MEPDNHLILQSVDFANTVGVFDPGMYTHDELWALARVIDKLPRGAGSLEIGVCGGRSASLLLFRQRDKDLQIVLVDNHDLKTEPARESFEALDRRMGVPYLFLHMTSEEAFYEIPEQKFNYIHIDGDHHGESVEIDCRWLSRLLPGGFACFHDYQTSVYPELTEIVNSYCLRGERGVGRYKLVDGGGRTVVFQKQGE